MDLKNGLAGAAALGTDIVEKLKKQPDLLAKFKENPVETLRGLTGIELSKEQLEELVETVKKLLGSEEVREKLGEKLGDLGKLF